MAFLMPAALFATGALVLGACTTVDPGPNLVIADVTFNADYFFCHVEPEVLFAQKCGPGDPTKGDPPGSCHFNASHVSGMVLIDHPAVSCSGNHPDAVGRTQVGAGSPAQSNLQAASLDMNQDLQTASIFVRPTGSSHPRVIFSPNDPVVAILRQWASQP